VPFSSPEGRQLFAEALNAGYMQNFFFLAEQFSTQDEPTYCGLTTLAMVLNTLRIDPMQTWKGVWRWFNEQMLSRCKSAEMYGPEKVREEGITFDLFKQLAVCHGAKVAARRAPSVTDAPHACTDFAEAFRTAVLAVTQSQARECLIVCYSREHLGQSGAGHFSPIGGYHKDSDSVLILDVARFKYPPHWAALEDVAMAMRDIDPYTGRPRGFLHLSTRTLDDDDSFPKPLHVPFVPAAAGMRLSESLTAALNQAVVRWYGAPEESVAMRRWLHAASVTEPQVLRKLLQVGDAEALREVCARLDHAFPLYRRLCRAYAVLAKGGDEAGPSFLSLSHASTDAACGSCIDAPLAEFPPLRFSAADDGAIPSSWPEQPPELCLDTCGELWVLLLLFLPEHLRAAVSADILTAPSVAQGAIARAVRCPWGLPLEALSETLRHALPPPTWPIGIGMQTPNYCMTA